MDPQESPIPLDISGRRVAVIGGGPGGYAAAFYAADRGFQVYWINQESHPGGTCLLRGCIPSKALAHAAKVVEESREAAAMGLQFGEPKIDLEKLRAWKDTTVVKALSDGLAGMAQSRKINRVTGKASFLHNRKLSIEKEGGVREELFFDSCIVATGSRSVIPKALQVIDNRVMDSTGALELKDIPKRLLVIGGGYIGLEMGSLYCSLGSEVTVVEALPELLAAADRDLVRPLQARMTGKFKAIWLATRVERLEPGPGGIKVHLAAGGAGPKEAEFDRVLVAVGREPYSEGLGLENIKTRKDARGFLIHDNQMRTDEPEVYVIGDLAGEPMLAHKAAAEARVAVDAVAGDKTAFDRPCVPGVVFTDPEIAWAGLTEKQAGEENIEVKVARFPWAASGRALTLGRPEGLTKLIFDPRGGRLLGMGVTGSGAADLISEGVLAIEMAATASDIAASIHPHPTLSETFMEAAELFLGYCTHLYRPKR